MNPRKPTRRFKRPAFRVHMENGDRSRMRFTSSAASWEEALNEGLRRWDNVYKGEPHEVRITR